jgi:hypothetical protein
MKDRDGMEYEWEYKDNYDDNARDRFVLSALPSKSEMAVFYRDDPRSSKTGTFEISKAAEKMLPFVFASGLMQVDFWFSNPNLCNLFGYTG